MNYIKTGFIIYLSAVIFGFLETWFFGWNWRPIQWQEYFCDGIAAGFAVYGAVLFFIGFIKYLFTTN